MTDQAIPTLAEYAWENGDRCRIKRLDAGNFYWSWWAKNPQVKTGEVKMMEGRANSGPLAYEAVCASRDEHYRLKSPEVAPNA